MYFNCFETQIRPGPGGQILFKPPYRSVLMGGSRGGNRKISSYMGYDPPPLEEVYTTHFEEVF